MMRGLRRVVALLVAALPLVAQERVYTHVVDDRPIVTVRAQVAAGAAVAGGAGFVRLEISNLDTAGHQVEVVLDNERNTGGVSVRHSLSLAGSERAVAFLPLPTPFSYGEFRTTIDGSTQAEPFVVQHGAAVHGLLLSDLPEAVPGGLAALQALPSGASDQPEMFRLVGAEAPTDWRLFTGFHAVVVDGRANVPEAVQEALRRFVFAGGLLVVASPDRLPAGSLREVATGATDLGRIVHGLGRLIVVDTLGGDSTALRTALRGMPQVQDGPWPANEVLCTEMEIPGLGRAPVLLFLLVILVFAVVAGPVNFLWLRRLRKPQLALVTVPVLGFGTTLVIVLFGLLNDGFGVRGVVRSWTVLDQGRREFAVVAARTLFAGIAPGRATMDADTLWLAPRATAGGPVPDRWMYDHGSRQLTGVLPSRTPTPMLSVQQGKARQRLVVRAQADGSLLLANDGGVEPVGRIVLRDFEGKWWTGTGAQLQPLSAEQGRDHVGMLHREAQTMKVREQSMHRGSYRRGGYFVEEQENFAVRPVGALADRVFISGDLPPGCYVTRVAQAPWLDELGFGSVYAEATHFVFGRLQREDFVR